MPEAFLAPPPARPLPPPPLAAELEALPRRVRLCAPVRRGGGGGGVGGAGGRGGGSVGGVGVWRKSCIILVLELALESA